MKTKKGLFTVAYAPQGGTVPVGTPHSWTITITRPDGTKPNRAEVAGFTGNMPEHGHGFPAKPVVSRPFGPGEVKISNINFSMKGAWEVTVQVKEGAAVDEAVFALSL